MGPQSRFRSPTIAGDAHPITWERNGERGSRTAQDCRKGGPSWRWTGWSLGWEEHFLRNLTSIYPLYHYEIYNQKKKKKKLRCLLLLREKRVLLLYKAVSVCFDTPLFELSSLAGRVSDIPGVWGGPCVVRGPWRLLCPSWKASYQCPGDCMKLSTEEHCWSRFYSCSLLKTNFTNK